MWRRQVLRLSHEPLMKRHFRYRPGARLRGLVWGWAQCGETIDGSRPPRLTWGADNRAFAGCGGDGDAARMRSTRRFGGSSGSGIREVGHEGLSQKARGAERKRSTPRFELELAAVRVPSATAGDATEQRRAVVGVGLVTDGQFVEGGEGALDILAGLQRERREPAALHVQELVT